MKVGFGIEGWEVLGGAGGRLGCLPQVPGALLLWWRLENMVSIGVSLGPSSLGEPHSPVICSQSPMLPLTCSITTPHTYNLGRRSFRVKKLTFMGDVSEEEVKPDPKKPQQQHDEHWLPVVNASRGLTSSQPR